MKKDTNNKSKYHKKSQNSLLGLGKKYIKDSNAITQDTKQRGKKHIESKENTQDSTQIEIKPIASVAIMGRPNVGKSSLFNRLNQKNIAITSHISGSTRDINKKDLRLNNFDITLIDTGGLEVLAHRLKEFYKQNKATQSQTIAPSTKDIHGINRSNKREQAIIATQLKEHIAFHSYKVVATSDIILYMVDGSNIVADEDIRIFRELSKQKPLLLVLNKVDNDKLAMQANDFMAFGVPYITISVAHNRGITKLLSSIENMIQELIDSKKIKAQKTLKTLDFLDYFDDTESILTFEDEELDSNPTLKSRTNSKTQATQNLDSNPCHVERSETSSIESLKDISLNTQCDNNSDSIPLKADMESKSQNNEFLDSINETSRDIESLSTISNQIDTTQNTDNTISIGIIGRPNVGKSSLLNALTNTNRSLVSDIAGTTIDPVDEHIMYNGYKLTFVDTAGIRRRSKIEGIEKYALDRTQKMLQECDIALLVLDCSTEFVELDEKISSIASSNGLGVIVVFHKWDIRSKEFDSRLEVYKRKFKFLEYAPIITASSTTHRHIKELKQKIIEVYQHFSLRIPTAKLNTCIQNALKKHPIPSDHGKIVRIYYATQFDSKPPKIALIMNRPNALHFSYKRYLINTLRQHFGFLGTPIIIEARSKKTRDLSETGETFGNEAINKDNDVKS
ncbi:ribosome biogenesis GTPase Der [Helicobacter bilis]|uniref:GTPase Der n=3 Tax=Helicobacter bilis TaxID=37372 RepID=A0A6D2C248_9HELI|nr:GTP-binding protein [Helicobacter bilis]EMZ37836.1 ribosome-associated GTPase EngA [Helicobacter bilis WiWa]TLE02389.1 ribosome biogenesis GTPase Der [Helicobacter bilis]TLE03068.1 ribosome biogenesis GTPase Der [Helicobacter bilis]